MAGRDHDWAAAVAAAKAAGKRAPCVELAATDPLYILYTSGTTGVAQGRGARQRRPYGRAAMVDGAIFGVGRDDTFWAGSDIGWVVGHSYIVYAPLLHGCASVLYEGKPVGTPDAGAFWRVIEDYERRRVLHRADRVSRGAARRSRGRSSEEIFDRLAARAVPGRRARRSRHRRLGRAHLAFPVIDHWWQTETGWPIVANPVGLGLLPVKRGSPTVPMPGYEIDVVDDAARPVADGTMGSIVIKLPLPPGALPTLYRQDARMAKPTSRNFPATTRPPTPASGTPTAI